MSIDNLRKVSVACTSLCTWVHAIDQYSKIVRDVAPKQARLKDMNAALQVANAQLEEKQV
jgi:dynein heavy chain